MKRLLTLIVALLAISACQTNGFGDRESHAVLVMVEDSDSGSLNRNSRVARRVMDEFADQISAHGFSVFDETALTFNTRRGQGTRRGDAQLIDIARGIRRPPIDTIALFTIFVDKQDRAHTRKLRVRVAGRLLSVQCGRRLGSFEVSETGNVRPGCTGPCFAEEVGDLARPLGQEVADILGEKLGARFGTPTPINYRDGMVRGLTLTFDNFSIVEIQDIESYLEIFSGYRSHRPITSFRRHFEIWYESSIAHARMQRNLERMFEELGMRARISFAGNSYNIRQLRVPVRARKRAPRYRW